jgi:hypothetical protein
MFPSIRLVLPGVLELYIFTMKVSAFSGRVWTFDRVSATKVPQNLRGVPGYYIVASTERSGKEEGLSTSISSAR